MTLNTSEIIGLLLMVLTTAKNNKKMAQNWTVVVREKQDKVNLYCDSCWKDANDMIEDIKEDLNEHKKGL